MSRLFPFIDSKPIEKSTATLPLYKEVAWDFQKNIPLIENGDFKFVEGIEAIKTWVWKSLNTGRYKYIIYSWDYGSELDSLIGQAYTPSYTTAETVRYIKEALLINPYINNIQIMGSTFKDGKLTADIKINTIYGEGQVNYVNV